MRTLTVLAFLCLCNTGYAQKHNNNWCFGDGINLSFNTLPPTTTPCAIDTRENAASVSNRNTGDLLFYADSDEVWNKNHQLMPNGSNISADRSNSGMQGTIIVPFIDSPDKYYIFTVGSTDTDPEGVLTYSVVDMNLDGGRGDVVQGRKNVLVDSGRFNEAMTTVPDDCGNIWLVLNQRNSNDFYAYKITKYGILNNPVTSPIIVHNQVPYGIMTMKISPDRSKLVLIAPSYFGMPSYVTLHDFDINTGRVSNNIILTQNSFHTGAFSANSQRLYITGHIREVYQYDLAQTSTAAIVASAKLVHKSNLAGIIVSMQRGPDDNLYLAFNIPEYLDRITNADNLYPNCTYTVSAIDLQSRRARLGMPQEVKYAKPYIGQRYTSRMDTTVCLSPAITLKAPSGRQNYTWQDGTQGDELQVTDYGTYWVTSTDGACTDYVDSFVINGDVDVYTANHTATICNGKPVILVPDTIITTADYKWNDGSNDTVYKTDAGGRYWVITTLATSCVVFHDTFDVEKVDIDVIVSTNDTIICRGDTIMVQSSSNISAATYKWTSGDIGSTGRAWESGYNTVTASYKGCEAKDDVYLAEVLPVGIDLGNDTFLCGTERLQLPKYVTNLSIDDYQWSTGSTGISLTITEPGTYYVTVSNRCHSASDTVNIIRKGCNVFMPSAFSPNRDGLNDILKIEGDLSDITTYQMIIYNRWGQQVYQSTYKYDGWDGQYKEKNVEIGTYYYYIEYTAFGEKQQVKGSVILVR